MEEEKREKMLKKPVCPFCNTKQYVNTMVKYGTGEWFLCSKCGANNFNSDEVWRKGEVNYGRKTNIPVSS